MNTVRKSGDQESLPKNFATRLKNFAQLLLINLFSSLSVVEDDAPWK